MKNRYFENAREGIFKSFPHFLHSRVLENANARVFHHTPVLMSEVVSGLALDAFTEPKTVVDATLGLGGHSCEFLRHLGAWDTLVGIELDMQNFEAARYSLTESSQTIPAENRANIHCIRGSFADIDAHLADIDITEITHMCYDLGVSSAHLDDGARGFSHRKTGPLDMRFDRTGARPTASQWLRSQEIDTLATALARYGEESHPYRMARAILAAFARGDIQTTDDLYRTVTQISRDPKSPTRVFQAIRIAVNDELDAVATSLEKALSLLAPGGRIAVISFHSVEDRLVKQLFSRYTTDERDELTGQTVRRARFSRVNTKPIVPKDREIAANPRARSAKLRIIEKRTDAS